MIDKFKKKYQSFRGFFKQTYNKHIAYLYITVAVLITLFVELLAGFAAVERSNLHGIKFLLGSPYIFICNAFIVLMSLSLTLLFQRRFFGISLVSIIWIILGITNAILVAVRTTPFTASDFTVIGSAFRIADKYLKTWHIVLIVLGLVFAITLIIFLFIKAPKIDHKINVGRNIFVVALLWVLCIGSIQLGRTSNLITKKFDNLRNSYFKYGFAYCFSNSLFNMGVTKPKKYDKDLVKNIEDENKNRVDGEKVKDTPNIIFVQLESFFEVNDLKNVSFSKNPIPNFEKLKESYPGGYMTVPVIGAGTVNTEFEISTGMSLEFFGSGEIPYNTYLHDRAVESICYNLKPYGYTSHAIHGNDATFYERYKVFPNLGYDTFDSIETMNIQDKNAYNPKNWLKDTYLMDEIMKTLDSTEYCDFIYTISVQGHGKYDPEDYESKIKVKGIEDEELKASYEYYADQMYEVDTFIKELTDRLNSFDENTIVVFFGDHLPSLDITEADLKNKNVYKTPYVIWSNYENNYFESRNIHTFQLESMILRALHISDGKINLCHQANWGKKYRKYKKDLHVLIYDMMDGEQEEEQNKYEPTEMKMGLKPITITNINISGESDSDCYVYGKNFTPACKIYINDRSVQTEYVDDSTLLVKKVRLNNDDIISLRLEDSKGLDFYEADTFTYQEDAMEKSREVSTKKNK